jgi:hypothetical protein
MDINLCPPAIIYLFFSLTQIIIDLFKGLYNTASVKAMVMVIVTILLNILCKQGLGVVSWIIVFIPFIMMTIIVSLILYAFGLNAATGKMQYNNYATTDASGNILIYDPNYNPNVNPVYYNSPNIVVPNPNETQNANPIITTQPLTNTDWYTSDPSYQS